MYFGKKVTVPNRQKKKKRPYHPLCRNHLAIHRYRAMMGRGFFHESEYEIENKDENEIENEDESSLDDWWERISDSVMTDISIEVPEGLKRKEIFDLFPWNRPKLLNLAQFAYLKKEYPKEPIPNKLLPVLDSYTFTASFHRSAGFSKTGRNLVRSLLRLHNGPIREVDLDLAELDFTRAISYKNQRDLSEVLQEVNRALSLPQGRPEGPFHLSAQHHPRYLGIYEISRLAMRNRDLSD